jgi:Flp pilus assembly protein TadD
MIKVDHILEPSMCRKLALAATAVLAIAVAPAAFAADKSTPAPAKAAPAIKTAKASKAERDMADRTDPATRADFWATQVALDPADAEAGLKLASALRALGQWDKAADTAEDVTIRHPDNEDAFLDLARAHIGGGDGFGAVQPLKQAQALNVRDWRPISLLAVAYEQTGRDDDAVQAYNQALTLAPTNPGVLTNLALFKLGKGDPAGAETLLRRAAALPGANEQTRQNLAYVLGREGRMDEAEKLMRQDLPPAVVSNNLAYLQATLAKPEAPARTWDALKSDGG